MANTVGHTALAGPYDRRDTIGPWFRGLVPHTPNVAAIAAAPLPYRVHALAGRLRIALLPSSRHDLRFSLPLHYLGRRPVVLRKTRPRRDAARGLG